MPFLFLCDLLICTLFGKCFKHACGSVYFKTILHAWLFGIHAYTCLYRLNAILCEKGTKLMYMHGQTEILSGWGVINSVAPI